MKHFDADRISKLLNCKYYWKIMIKNVKKYINTCNICQKVKMKHHLSYNKLKSLFRFTDFWKEITMNFIIDLSFNKWKSHVQYLALSHSRALFNQYTSHLHQSLNHQIQLGNFNIWASYLVVYDLWFFDQYLVCQPFAIITAAHLSSILNISSSITFSCRFAQVICKIWNNWVSASSSLFFSEFRFE